VQVTLQKVAVDLKKGVDVNKDGKINCIDVAVLFYQHYPDKTKVRIMLNVNKSTGMNHIFNAVWKQGCGWWQLEPQVAYNKHSSPWMRDVWGSKYNNLYNLNTTDHYLKYVK
jgi:hypothetical protein